MSASFTLTIPNSYRALVCFATLPTPYALYEVSVRQTRCLPPASFRFQLAMDTLAIGCMIPAIRDHWGLGINVKT